MPPTRSFMKRFLKNFAQIEISIRGNMPTLEEEDEEVFFVASFLSSPSILEGNRKHL